MSDLLPPGNQPAPAVGDDPRQFPDFFASDIWPAMWPREVFAYANAAARDAELTGLGPSDIAFAFLKDIKLLTYWNGTAWASAAGRRASGSLVITPSAANTPTSGAITFPAGLFSASPVVSVTPVVNNPGTIVTGWAVTGSSTTGATLWVTRANTTATTLYWSAVQDS